MSTPALFQPIRIGNTELKHRVALAPLTRLRNDAAHVPTELVIEYYAQRASVPGTLLVSEGTYIAPQASGQPHAPGIWNDAQIAAWKKVVNVVHAKGSFIYCQLWALGRAARPDLLHAEYPDFDPVSASALAIPTNPDHVPRALTKEEIKEWVGWYAQAAKNAIAAGFDGIEVHGANGYLPDQFLQDVTNIRTDEYGGSIENRARFMLEIVDAIVSAIGAKRTALRMSPWNKYQGMGDSAPVATFSYVVEQLKARHPDLAYLHTVTSAAFGSEPPRDPSTENFIAKIWDPRPLVITGGFVRETAIKRAEEAGHIIGFGTLFIANPDLPFRLQHDLPLNAPNVDGFYVPMVAEGYTDYPFSKEFLESQK
ncbi:NADH:flavin oxidoreductase/NADH oxidase [Epithele typhae]|uniref:NADH:flavin oxidoreductase/NADH oxidase n=1 Tax=Epithele typhae TaxID=378194 RepID=UPI00200797EE|nr:NADH:flavin oxidoreductase/NADH oxidase [Epithele typhae]KAH9925903.1 NADH:flavin oxidoreductase/NADH oxidase [Epithele typhae]